MKQEAMKAIAAAIDYEMLQSLQVKYLGKNGILTKELKILGQLPPHERKSRGQELNATKQFLEQAIRNQRTLLEQEDVKKVLERERVDVSLPGYGYPIGGQHILTQIVNRLIDVFHTMSYEVVVGPELETDHYNFSALNFPDEHPARDTQDTFWTTDGRLLRTHTSPVQIRYMENHKPPFKIVVPGRVFRNEAIDATHEAQFHQFEALVVDERITMGDLRGAINTMAKSLFGDRVKTKLQPSFFPFVEPGAEFSIWWENPRTGCSEWLELGGCGMVHPNVFKSVGYENVTGFAFGFGIERLALTSSGIPDIRYFHQNDVRFLKQFRGNGL